MFREDYSDVNVFVYRVGQYRDNINRLTGIIFARFAEKSLNFTPTAVDFAMKFLMLLHTPDTPISNICHKTQHFLTQLHDTLLMIKEFVC